MSEVGNYDLSKILKRYLSHIVYIDDVFNVSWNLTKKEELIIPSRSNRRYGNSDKISNQKYNNEIEKTSDLEKFCEFVQKNYPEILLTPIKYTSYTDNSQLSLHMKNARLLILDWNLSEKITAIKLLNQSKFSGQLRFCVIYTSMLLEAKSEFIENIEGVKEQGLTPGEFDSKNYEYVRANSTIYMICEKDKFDFNMIIGALMDIFIKEVGYFPIAFIDMISGLEKKVPYYLNKFAQPFDKLLLLQTNSDGLPMEDMYHTISDMVINNIKSDIDLNESVLKSIYNKQIEALRELLESEDVFKDRVNRTIDIIFAKLECNKRLKEAVRNISIVNYRTIVQKVIKNPDTLYKGVENAGRFLAKCCADQMANKIIQEYRGGDDIQHTALIKELSSMYRHQFEEKIKKILPSCLITLLDPEQEYEIDSLITSLKTVSYDNGEKYLYEIFNGVYEDHGDTMSLLCDNNGTAKLALLQNKLKSGDIIFEKADFDENCMAYLCILPSCHMLRPKKVDGKILFLKGKIINDYPKNPLRDNEHFTILPRINDKKQVHIIWQYHNVLSMDMSKINKVNFQSYYRPYRLIHDYLRQIVGEFISFYSKSGVEELFIKSDVSLHQLIFNEKVESND